MEQTNHTNQLAQLTTSGDAIWSYRPQTRPLKSDYLPKEPSQWGKMVSRSTSTYLTIILVMDCKVIPNLTMVKLILPHPPHRFLHQYLKSIRWWILISLRLLLTSIICYLLTSIFISYLSIKAKNCGYGIPFTHMRQKVTVFMPIRLRGNNKQSLTTTCIQQIWFIHGLNTECSWNTRKHFINFKK